jgi:ATP-binding protein involved in chromosome partitioning
MLNLSHFICGSCTTKHELFGNSSRFEKAASEMGLDVLGHLPLVTQVSDGGDAGRPVMVQTSDDGQEIRETMRSVAKRCWEFVESSEASGATTGTRG